MVFNCSLPNPPAVFTLGEIRLLKSLYHELSIEELAIFFGKSPADISSICKELDLKKQEVCYA